MRQVYKWCHTHNIRLPDNELTYSHFLGVQVNDIVFHPVHGTLATVGSDGRYNFWDKDVRTKLKSADQLNQPIVACDIDSSGKVIAYATSYDWCLVSY